MNTAWMATPTTCERTQLKEGDTVKAIWMYDQKWYQGRLFKDAYGELGFSTPEGWYGIDCAYEVVLIRR